MKLLTLVISSLAATLALAGNAGPGTLSTVHFFGSGVIIVYTTGSRTNIPGCVIYPDRFAFDSSTAGGKSQLAGLLSAYSMGKQVSIIGTGTCSVSSGTETIEVFYTND